MNHDRHTCCWRWRWLRGDATPRPRRDAEASTTVVERARAGRPGRAQLSGAALGSSDREVRAGWSRPIRRSATTGGGWARARLDGRPVRRGDRGVHQSRTSWARFSGSRCGWSIAANRPGAWRRPMHGWATATRRFAGRARRWPQGLRDIRQFHGKHFESLPNDDEFRKLVWADDAKRLVARRGLAPRPAVRDARGQTDPLRAVSLRPARPSSIRWPRRSRPTFPSSTTIRSSSA